MFSGSYGAMVAAAVVDHGPMERARLAALHASRAGDPTLQPALDRVASCAAFSLKVPLGAVSLVDEGAVVLAGMHGFDHRRTDRAGSFCAELVRSGERLLIGDARIDERFRNHPFVSQGGVRAYAGAPIKAAGGEVLGAVAAFAGEPDAFRPAALDDLEALAHMVELLLARPGPVEAELPVVRRQGWIGVRTLDAHRTGTAARAGLVVLSVARGSPAQQAGVRVTDILYAVDDQVLRERADLVGALSDREPGSLARITLQRAGQWLELWVPVGSRRRSRADRPSGSFSA